MTSTPRKGGSLIAQLSQSVLAAVCVFWLLGSAATAWHLDREIAETLDSALKHSAHRLLDLVAHELEEAGSHAGSTPVAPQPVVETLGDEYLMYQVTNTSGALLMRSQDAPEHALPVPAANGFSQVAQWRVYTLRHPVLDLSIHVADPLRHRREARNGSLVFLLWTLAIGMPLLLLAIYALARRSLRPVQHVTDQIAQRSGRNLQPVDGTALPTELQVLAGTVNHLLARLNDALQTERALAANAAHELRTPLATARLRLSSALAHPLPAAAHEDVTRALDALVQLTRRAEKLLQLSRAESAAALARDPVDLAQVLNAVLGEFEGDDAAYRRLLLDETAPCLAVGDFDAMAVAVRNLVENAMRYGGGGVVHMGLALPATVWVQDSGPGVTPEQLARMTQRHVRHAQDEAGFGLGLSIVKTIMERHQGQLELLSPPPGMPHGLLARLQFQPVSPTHPAASAAAR